MIEWLKQLRKSFGFSFLWLICLIYFTQGVEGFWFSDPTFEDLLIWVSGFGKVEVAELCSLMSFMTCWIVLVCDEFEGTPLALNKKIEPSSVGNSQRGFRTFVWTAVSYQLKDRLKLSPSASQFVHSIAIFPWSIKPLYGILSDCIPIGGRKRIPYLVVASVFSLFPWLVLGLNAPLMDSKVHLMISLTVQNLGSAMADVVVDAMIAEAVRFERAAFTGDLQSLSWLAMAIGGICGSLLGGYALTNIEIGSSQIVNGDNNVLDEDSSNSERSRISTSRRKKRRTNKKKRAVIKSKSQISEKDGSLALQWFRTLKMAACSLYSAFRQPIILRMSSQIILEDQALAKIYLVEMHPKRACPPMTEFLNLEASFLGTVRVVGWLGLMLGTFTYNHYLKKMRLRRILMLAHVGYSFMSLLNIALVARTNVVFGISDKIMVLCGSAFHDAIHQFKFMPFLILSGRLCPPGIEGTLFALFMSINNLGTTIGSFMGAGLASVLNISSGSFDNLLLGMVIQVLCTFIPIAFLFLIPKEATGIST
ncbi:putative folate-biopterin transporter 4 [Vitis vinifera]|uniref:Putative folate-biopterin transporter 4 n=1 Tax=Vitis vinifera TaxID=29760 RepID=A0A438DXS5_VITVI|nr:putative folate-biopterin transporter 4 [Vitis vinifera]